MGHSKTVMADPSSEASKFDKFDERRLFYFLVAFYALVHVSLVIARRPYFGNMDDSAFLRVADAGDPLALARAYDRFGQTAWPANGFFRPTSFLLLNYLYSAANALGPLALYLINSLGVVAIVVFLTNSLHTFVGTTDSLFRPLFLVGFFTWPFSVEVMMFPSLQQKVIILAVGAFVWALGRVTHSGQSPPRLFALLGAILLMFGTKTQIVLLTPAVLYLLYIKLRAKDLSVRMWVLSTLTVSILAVTVAYAAFQGNYTSGTRGSSHRDLVALLSDKRLLMLGGSVACLGLAHAVGRRNNSIDGITAGRTTGMSAKVLQRFGISVGLAYVASFFVWDIRNYYLAVASISFAFLPWSVLINASRRVQRIGALILLFIASLVAIVRLTPVYDSFFSIREFLSSEEATLIARDEQMVVLFMSEARVRFTDYARSLGVPDIMFVTSQQARERCEDESDVLVMGDSKLSPLSSAFREGGWQPDERVWDSTRSAGYEVWSIHDSENCGP